MAEPVAGRNIMARGRMFFFSLGIVYAAVIVLLAIPNVQKQ